MTRMGSASHTGELKRFNKGLRASKKSILYSDYYEDENKKEGNLASQRSISMGALHQSNGTLEPRMAQLETLEAKMASIEVSLSTTPRRKKSSSAATTPVPQPIHSIVNMSIGNGYKSSPTPCNNNINNNNNLTTTLPTTNGPAILPVKEFVDPLRSAYKDKENVFLGSRNGWGSLGRPTQAGILTERERKLAQERLTRLKAEMDSKRLAIKNIKIGLDTIDISDNIDVRIQQAELEYKLGREELNLLSMLEETRNLQACLEENSVPPHTIFSYIGKAAVSLHAVEMNFDPKSPQFGVGQREEGFLQIEWAADSSGLCKGDRVLEVNGKLVPGKTKDEMYRLLSVSPNPAQIVVMRKHSESPQQIMSHLQAELSVVREKAGEAERTRDSFRSDNLRLTHRISYLEEQVAELLERARESKSVPTPQVFQKGNQVALVGNLPGLDKSEKKGLPPPRPRHHSEEVRSAKSVDVLIEKPKRKKDLALPSGHHHHHRHSHVHDRSTDHLHGELRQKHLREARSSLFTFMDRRPTPPKATSTTAAPPSASDSEHTQYNGHNTNGDSQTECHSEASTRYYKKHERPTRPVPPKKPIRLSLHRATSLQSMENNNNNHHQLVDLKKSLKRSHKGDAPAVPLLTNGQHHVLLTVNGQHPSTLEGNWC